ncbi:MAG: SCP2 sterol-binding domain-containing protein [Candidatus Nezhaarchaeales archaeon]
MPLDTTTLVLLSKVKEELNSSQRFLNAVKGWNSRILVNICPPDPRIAYSYKVFLEIINGKCQTIRVLEPEEEVSADIQVTMDLGTYEELLKGRTSSISAALRGRLKISGKKFELLKRREALEVLNEVMRKLLFQGGAILTLLPYLRREFTF